MVVGSSAMNADISYRSEHRVRGLGPNSPTSSLPHSARQTKEDVPYVPPQPNRHLGIELGYLIAGLILVLCVYGILKLRNSKDEKDWATKSEPVAKQSPKSSGAMPLEWLMVGEKKTR